MHFRTPDAAPGVSARVGGALGALAAVALFAGIILADFIRTGNLLDAHARPIAVLILLTLVSLAALASSEGNETAP